MTAGTARTPWDRWEVGPVGRKQDVCDTCDACDAGTAVGVRPIVRVVPALSRPRTVPAIEKHQGMG